MSSWTSSLYFHFYYLQNFGRIQIQHLQVIFTQILKDRCTKILYRVKGNSKKQWLHVLVYTVIPGLYVSLSV